MVSTVKKAKSKMIIEIKIPYQILPHCLHKDAIRSILKNAITFVPWDNTLFDQFAGSMSISCQLVIERNAFWIFQTEVIAMKNTRGGFSFKFRIHHTIAVTEDVASNGLNFIWWNRVCFLWNDVTITEQQKDDSFGEAKNHHFAWWYHDRITWTRGLSSAVTFSYVNRDWCPLGY